MDAKRHLRAIVRRVHPDLFSDHPQERAQNSESLKALNVYVDASAKGQIHTSVPVAFWVEEDGRFVSVQAELPSYGSLGPLFHAFGLISDDELKQGMGGYDTGAEDRNFLQWLSQTVSEAVRTADEHERLKGVIRELRAAVEAYFGLVAIQVGGEFAISTAEQDRQIEALQVLQTCLTAMTADASGMFEGLSIRLYHPDGRPSDPYSVESYLNSSGNRVSGEDESYIADDGRLHIVADRASIQSAMASLDLNRARLLTRLSLFWVRRVRELTPALKQLLGVENVWCDTRTESSSQQFVLWAGSVLDARHEFESALQSRHFAFSVLVHSDDLSPVVEFLASSSVLQVRSDCQPRRLLEYMCSDAGLAANAAAAEGERIKAREDELLQQVRTALGAKHVIRVCSASEQSKVVSAAERLLASAAAIRGVVDLSGASIAIDDCYELWESGFISIPYNFRVEDLQPQIQRLLGTGADQAGNAAGGASSSHTAGASSSRGGPPDIHAPSSEGSTMPPSSSTPAQGKVHSNGTAHASSSWGAASMQATPQAPQQAGAGHTGPGPAHAQHQLRRPSLLAPTPGQPRPFASPVARPPAPLQRVSSVHARIAARAPRPCGRQRGRAAWSQPSSLTPPACQPASCRLI